VQHVPSFDVYSDPLVDVNRVRLHEPSHEVGVGFRLTHRVHHVHRLRCFRVPGKGSVASFTVYRDVLDDVWTTVRVIGRNSHQLRDKTVHL